MLKWLAPFAVLSIAAGPLAPQRTAAPDRPRVLVSTDIGGTDPDDFQSMVHFLLYADVLDVEGIISSPYGPGRREHILQVIDRYAADYSNLKRFSDRYPEPDALRRLAKQGAIDSSTGGGVGQRTEGSDWIVQCARRNDARPLWVLVWGGIDDLAQALHDAPDVVPKLRVYFIGGPNKMWSVDAYNYIAEHHPNLWMIEANSTYRGWFVGGNQSGEWGNSAFVAARVAGRGALGEFFATQLSGTIKMGDSPSVGYLLRNTLEDPSRPGWGGQFVRIWDGRKTIFTRLTTERDVAEAFGVVEFALPVPSGMSPEHSARMIFDNRIPAVATREGSVLRFRFSPRDAKVWPYVIRSSFAALDGQSGSFTAAPPPIERTARPSARLRHWWIDNPDPGAAEGVHAGVRSVSRWREEFLRDFAERLDRTRPQVRAREAVPARHVGRRDGRDSSGSEALIAAVDRDDPRPLWVPVWGGPNVLAQALWKVRATRSPEALATFVAKLRVYTISDQDDSGPWIRKTFPGLFYIASPGLHAGGAYHFATWSGISGDTFHARFAGADSSLVENPWLDLNIRRKAIIHRFRRSRTRPRSPRSPASAST